jgi:hypothetical protein
MQPYDAFAFGLLHLYDKLIYFNEKLRDETLTWWNSTINRQKQKTTKLLAIDFDKKGRCGLPLLFFFLCLFCCSLWTLWVLLFNDIHYVVVSSLDKFWMGLLVCIVFWRTSIKEEVLELRIRIQKFSDEKYLSTLMLVVFQCGFFITDYSHFNVIFQVWTTLWPQKDNKFLMCHELQERE